MLLKVFFFLAGLNFKGGAQDEDDDDDDGDNTIFFIWGRTSPLSDFTQNNLCFSL